LSELRLTPALTALLTGYLVALGLVVGSFLNVVIARVPEGLSVVRPRSRCPRCGHVLAWYENIPVFSWLLLRARCSGCRLPISVRYPLIELLTGALFLATLLRFDWSYALAPPLVFICLLVSLAFIDADHWLLPFSLTLPGIAAGILMSIPEGRQAVVLAVAGAMLAFLSLRAMEFLGWLLFRKEALGGGDKYLFAMIGAFLGPFPLLGVLFLASLQGALFGLARIALTGRAGPAAERGPEAGEEAPPSFRFAFLAPGLPLARRLLLVPYALLVQPIPDDPVDEGGEEVEWTPGVTNLPFGPWLALGALEVMLLGPWLQRVLPPGLSLLVGGLP